MSNNIRKGFVLVISSPSGAGKTTICKKIIEEVDSIDLSVSVTTRKKRKDEINGRDYFLEVTENLVSWKKIMNFWNMPMFLVFLMEP